MNKLTTLLFLIPFIVLSQLPYSWTAGVNPGWTSTSNIVGQPTRVLNYQPTAGFVSSNDFPAGNRYVNGQITEYKSPVINTTCTNASTVSISFTIGVDLETRWDWGYFQYSLNNGVTWVNSVAMSAQNNPSNVNLGAYPPLINWANNNSNRNGWTGVVNNTFTYIIPTSVTSRYRFIFASDGTVNYYTNFGTQYDYFFDIYSFNINCNIVLPINLIYFKGYKESKENKLTWLVESETNCEHYTLERSDDGVKWVVINITTATNSNAYTVYDSSFIEAINYYRLSQIDYNGEIRIFDITSIDNRKLLDGKIVKTVNSIGQEIDPDNPACGVVFDVYEDGSIKRRMLKTE